MTAQATTDADRPAPPSAARPPVSAGAITFVGALLALLLTVLAVVLLRDALVAAGVLGGKTWLTTWLAKAGTLSMSSVSAWLVPAGVVVALVGLWLVLLALRPRPRRTFTVAAATGVHLQRRDIARLAAAVADDVDGVMSARASASKRAVTVTVETTGASDVAGSVETVVTQRLASVSPTPRVRVKARNSSQEGSA